MSRPRPILRTRLHVPAVLLPVTRLGWTVVALALVAWVAAWRTGWDELAVVVATLVVLVALAVPFTIGRSEFEISIEAQPRRVSVGDRANGVLEVRNVADSRSLPTVVELPVGVAAAAFRIPSLAPGATHDELFAVPTHRRAVIPVGPATSVRGDPLGLVRREREFPERFDLYVHPRIDTLDRLGAGFLRDLEGQTTNDLSPSDVAFHTLREYVPGDDRRHIHWKTTARIGKMMVRQFVDTRRSFLSLVVSTDEHDYADDEEFELAISMAASLGVRALRDEQTVSVVAGEHQRPSAGVMSFLDGCSGIEHDGPAGGLHHAVATANRVAADASIVAVAVGSVPTVADVRAASLRLRGDGRVLILRADRHGLGSFRDLGGITVVTASTLDEFGRQLVAVGGG